MFPVFNLLSNIVKADIQYPPRCFFNEVKLLHACCLYHKNPPEPVSRGSSIIYML